jgi:hypothetical protein
VGEFLAASPISLFVHRLVLGYGVSGDSTVLYAQGSEWGCALGTPEVAVEYGHDQGATAEQDDAE